MFAVICDVKNVDQHDLNIDYNQKKLEGATNSVGGAVDFMTYLVVLAINFCDSDIMRFISPYGNVSNYMGSKMVGINCKTTWALKR